MSKPEKTEPGKLGLFFRALWELIHRNWGYKLLALLLAMILWAGLITQDPSLTRQKTMTAEGSAITISGATNAARTRHGNYIVTAGLDTIPEITITADVPQLNYQNASAQDYAPYIDLRNIGGVGEQEIPISTKTDSKTGTVTKIEPATVTVTVDRYTTAGPIALNPVPDGSLNGWYLGNLETGESVSISGPESIVGTVRSVEVVLDLDELTDENGALKDSYRKWVGKPYNDSKPFRLVCDNGVTYSSDELEALQVTVAYNSATVSRIPLTYTIMACKSLTLAPDVPVTEGTPAAGCAVARIVKPTVTVAGSESDLAGLTYFRLGAALNIEGQSDTVSGTVAAIIDGDADLIWLDSDGRPLEGSGHRVDITVVIRPEVPVTPAVTGELPPGWRLEGDPVCDPVAVTVLNAARETARVEAVLDLSALMPTEAGTFTEAVAYRLLDAEGQEIPTGSQAEVRSNASLQTAIGVTYTLTATGEAEEPEGEEEAEEAPVPEAAAESALPPDLPEPSGESEE